MVVVAAEAELGFRGRGELPMSFPLLLTNPLLNPAILDMSLCLHIY